MNCKCLERFWENTPEGLLVDPDMAYFCTDNICEDGSN